MATTRKIGTTSRDAGKKRVGNGTNPHFTSATDEWGTPQDFYDALDREFHFTLDPCSTALNAKCKRHFTRKEDGLVQPWTGTVFMNPPYGRAVGQWIRKAWEESRLGATVVCLIAARPDTAYWA
jgi:phage N-6-adenine-methyltransferase